MCSKEHLYEQLLKAVAEYKTTRMEVALKFFGNTPLSLVDVSQSVNEVKKRLDKSLKEYMACIGGELFISIFTFTNQEPLDFVISICNSFKLNYKFWDIAFYSMIDGFALRENLKVYNNVGKWLLVYANSCGYGISIKEDDIFHELNAHNRFDAYCKAWESLTVKYIY